MGKTQSTEIDAQVDAVLSSGAAHDWQTNRSMQGQGHIVYSSSVHHLSCRRRGW